MKIKVCGMRDGENINGLIKLSPDFMGLIFYRGSKRFVGADFVLPHSFNPDAIDLVGVFVNEEYGIIVDKAVQYGLKYIQLHGKESTDLCLKLRGKGFRVIKAIQIGDELPVSEIRRYEPSVDFFLFDTRSSQYGGTGRKFDWGVLDGYQSSVPYFLSGGISKEDLTKIKALKLNGLYAVDVNSAFEIKPGIKDLSLVKQAVEELA